MGRPQKSQVFKANVNALGNIAQPLRDAAKTLASSGERVHTTVQEFDWEGAARESAVARSDRELTQNRIVAADLDALADAYENGKKTMGPMIDGLKSKARGLEGNHFEVSENWDVKDTYDYAAARKLATMMDPADTAGLQEQITQLQNRRANEAATEGGNLGRLADELGVADTNTATAISNAVAALGGANGPKLAPRRWHLVKSPIAALSPAPTTQAPFRASGLLISAKSSSSPTANTWPYSEIPTPTPGSVVKATRTTPRWRYPSLSTNRDDHISGPR